MLGVPHSRSGRFWKKIEQSLTPPWIESQITQPVALSKYPVCCHIEHQVRSVFTNRPPPRVVKALPRKRHQIFTLLHHRKQTFLPDSHLNFSGKNTPFSFCSIQITCGGFHFPISFLSNLYILLNINIQGLPCYMKISPITVAGSRDVGCEVDILPLPQCSLTLCCPYYYCEFQRSYPN